MLCKILGTPKWKIHDFCTQGSYKLMFSMESSLPMTMISFPKHSSKCVPFSFLPRLVSPGFTLKIHIFMYIFAYVLFLHTLSSLRVKILGLRCILWVHSSLNLLLFPRRHTFSPLFWENLFDTQFNLKINWRLFWSRYSWAYGIWDKPRWVWDQNLKF